MRWTIRILSVCVAILACLVGGAFAQQSRIELHHFNSTVFGSQADFNIFLPEGYDSETERYPVVFLFRGAVGEWANPTQDNSRRGNIKTVADALFADDKIGKMIVVMPGLTSNPDMDRSFVVGELIPYVDQNFRTLPDRWHRGMDGFSLGGYSMINLLWRNPERFSSAGAYDGSFQFFNFTDMINAPESYWALLRPMKFLIHVAVVNANNGNEGRAFLSILAAHGIQNGFQTLGLSPSAEHNWFYADLHMSQSLPLHWEQFRNAPVNVSVSLSSPNEGSKIAGPLQIRWSVPPTSVSLMRLLEFSRDRGRTWRQLGAMTTVDSAFVWNTLGTPDGTLYMLRARVFGDSLYGIAQSPGVFTIDNPGNGLPDVEILSPARGETYSGVRDIRYFAADPEGESLRLTIDASSDNGLTWGTLASDLQNTGSFSWDTRTSPSSERFKLRIRCGDGTGVAEVVSPLFSVQNLRPFLADTLVRHVSGSGDGKIAVRVADLAKLTGHTYRISFQDTASAPKTYSVRDVNLNAIVVDRAPVLRGGVEGPLFDGLRLVVTDIDTARVAPDSTRWIVGKGDLVPSIFLPRVSTGEGLLVGVPYPADYLITISDHVVDTSFAFLGSPEIPLKFTVRNVTEGHQVKVAFLESENDSTISRRDDLIILERDAQNQPFMCWELFFVGSESSSRPLPGDMFKLRILKPLSRKDLYEFTALGSGVVSVKGGSATATFGLSQNYPNPFNPETVVRFEIPVVRGQGSGVRDQGSGVSDVKLSVYDILGREVAVLVNEKKEPGSYDVQFDGSNLSSGVYFYRLTAGSFVQTRKMLLVR